MYIWNFRFFAESYLGEVLRKAKHIALLYALTKPMQLLYNDFLEYKAQTDLLVRYNGQTKSLEALLNSVFDSTLNRIYIVTDGDAINNVYTYYRSERGSFFTTNRSEAGYQPVYNYFRSEDVTLDTDFTVYVPEAIATAKSTEINAWINRYKIAGKQHLIQPI